MAREESLDSGGDIVGDWLSKGRRGRGQEGARGNGGGAIFLRGGSRVVGADLCGEAGGAVGDAGLEGAGLPPGLVMGAAGRGGKFGAEGVRQAGGGGVERYGKGFGEGQVCESSGGLAGGLGWDGGSPLGCVLVVANSPV